MGCLMCIVEMWWWEGKETAYQSHRTSCTSLWHGIVMVVYLLFSLLQLSQPLSQRQFFGHCPVKLPEIQASNEDTLADLPLGCPIDRYVITSNAACVHLGCHLRYCIWHLHYFVYINVHCVSIYGDWMPWPSLNCARCQRISIWPHMVCWGRPLSTNKCVAVWTSRISSTVMYIRGLNADSQVCFPTRMLYFWTSEHPTIIPERSNQK